MREFLDDAHAHRQDGYGRAQKQMRDDLPKRFYKTTGVGVVDGGFAVTLDGRATRTPGRVPIVVPHAGIATVMAEEWAVQGELINAETMPTVRLINSAVEGGEANIPALRAEIVKFAGNDLLLYRADSPQELVAEQDSIWDAALVKLARHFGVIFQPTVGIIHQPQPPATLAKLAEALDELGLFVLTGLMSVTGLTGSGLLAIALRETLLTPEEIWTAAHVDEDYQARLWGEVEEAVVRRAKRRKELDAAVHVIELMRAG
jgi:chaperone required for assembly of F1-ATPase